MSQTSPTPTARPIWRSCFCNASKRQETTRPSASSRTATGPRSPGSRWPNGSRRWRPGCSRSGSAEDRIGIASATRLEWILADLAILCAGGATTTVYPSTNAEDTAYILADSGSKIVFAEDDAQLKKLTEQRGELPNLAKVVVFDGASDDDWVDHPGRPRRPGREVSGRAPLLRAHRRRGDQPLASWRR